MRSRTAVVLALATALAGCPLPQPLPEYRQGQTVTPPRILADLISVDGVPSSTRAVILVPANCTGTAPSYELSAQIHDTTNLPIQARWFVNYHPSYAETFFKPHQADTIPPNPDPLVLVRDVPPRNPSTGAPQPFVFSPYDYPPPAGMPASGPLYPGENVLRVVELVVSQGFDPDATAPPAALPNRTPEPNFETQVYRWVFLTVPAKAPADPCVPATDPTCVKCPQ